MRKAGVDGKNSTKFPEEITGYFEIIQQLNSALIKDVLGLQRAAALRALDLPPASVMPSFKTATIDGGFFFLDICWIALFSLIVRLPIFREQL